MVFIEILVSCISPKIGGASFQNFDMSKNSERLSALIHEVRLCEDEALELWNRSQATTLTDERWKAYLAAPDTPRWKPCPDSVILRMERRIQVRSATVGHRRLAMPIYKRAYKLDWYVQIPSSSIADPLFSDRIK